MSHLRKFINEQYNIRFAEDDFEFLRNLKAPGKTNFGQDLKHLGSLDEDGTKIIAGLMDIPLDDFQMFLRVLKYIEIIRPDKMVLNKIYWLKNN